MIDLNYQKPKKKDETPIGVVILAVMPFVLGFWMMIWRAL